VLIVAAACVVPAPRARAADAEPAPTVSVRAGRLEIVSGRSAVIAGTATPASGPGVVRLLASPYPYRSFVVLDATAVSADGSFSFEVRPDRNTRYRVELVGTPAQATVSVGVTGRTATRVRALSLGRVGVTILVFHPRDLRWGGARVAWSFGVGRRSRLRPAPATRARRISQYVVALHTTMTLPAGRFRFRACFDPPSAAALTERRRPGCRGQDYQGGGSLPVGFPGPVAIERAGRYLSARFGRTAFAVVDSEGRVSGMHIHRTFVTGSVVKAMLLVAYLRRLDALGRRHIDPGSASFLYAMIHVSDNAAATVCWSIVGDGRLYALAHAAGMTDFSISGDWAQAQLSPADQARFFFEMDSLIPREFVGYARFLLSTIAGYESWGIPAIARPRGYQVFFKGGWRPTPLGQLVHQIGRLEGHGRTFSLAVMTDGDPSMGYGIATIEGLTRTLL
jgi:hypothetical protein